MALENDTQAPDFELVDQYGQTVRLSDLTEAGPVALVFFPMAFSGICTGELCSLRDNLDLFGERGVTVAGVSVDSKYTLRAWSDRERVGFTLLSDFWPHGQVAKEYGVFLEDVGFANRATFLIDGTGTIKASFITAPGEPRDIEAYRTALQSLPAA